MNVFRFYQYAILALILTLAMSYGQVSAGNRLFSSGGGNFTIDISSTTDSANLGDTVGYAIQWCNNSPGAVGVDFDFLAVMPDTTQQQFSVFNGVGRTVGGSSPFSLINPNGSNPNLLGSINVQGTNIRDINPANTSDQCQNITLTGQVVVGEFGTLFVPIFMQVRDASAVAPKPILWDFSFMIPLYPRVDVSITKAITGTYGLYQPQQTGDIIDRELTLVSSGARGASGIIIDDLFDPALNFVSVVSSNNIVCPTIPCTVDIPRNTTGTVIVRTRVQTDIQNRFPGFLFNTGTIATGVIQTGLFISQSQDDSQISIAGLPDLYINTVSLTTPIFDGDDIIALQFTVGNNGNAGVSGNLTIDLPSSLLGMQQMINGISANRIGNQVQRNNLFFPVGSSIVVTLTGQTNGNLSGGTILGFSGNIALPASIQDREFDLSNNTFLINETVVGRPDLSLNKILITSPIGNRLNDPVVYRITFANNGTTGATNVVLTDLFDPAYFAYDSLSGSTTCNGSITAPMITSTNPVRVSLGALPAGCSGVVDISGRLIEIMNQNDVFINTGFITNTLQELSVDMPNTGTATYVIDGYTDIQLTGVIQSALYLDGSTCIGPVCPLYGSGDTITFAFIIGNSGNIDAFVNYNHLFDTTVMQCITNCTANIQIAPQTQTIVLLQARLNNTISPLTYQNTFTVTENTTTFVSVVQGLILGRAELSIDKTTQNNLITQGPYYPGDTVSFLLTISNTLGTRQGTGVLQDLLPANLSFVSGVVINPSAGSIVGGGFPYNFIVGTGQSLQVRLTTSLLGAKGDGVRSTFTNESTIQAPGPRHNVVQSQDTDTFTIHPQRQLAITKQIVSVTYGDDDRGTCVGVTCPIYGSGDLVQFAIVIANTGNTQVTGLQIIDENIVGQNFVAQAISDGGQVQANNIVRNNIGLATGDVTRTLLFTGLLQSDVVANVTNLARLNVSSVPDRNALVDRVLNDISIVNYQRLGRAYLYVDKTVQNNAIDQGPYYPGQNVSFILSVTNQGTRIATGIMLSDIAPTSINVVGIPVTPLSILPGTTQTFVVTGVVQGIKGEFVGSFVNTGQIADPTNHNGTTVVVPREAETFMIRPRTELSLDKTYLGMRGNSLNPQDPYGNRYGTWQQVGFSLRLINTGNVQATNLQIQDVLPSVMNFIGTDRNTNFTQASLTWSNITIDMDGSVVVVLTAAINTEIPQQFTNLSRYLTPTTCTPGQASPICQIIVNTQDTATGNILGMARITIDKTMLSPSPTRFDPRFGQLASVALPGDRLGFRLTVVNTGTRVATGLQLRDIFSDFVNDTRFPTMEAMRLDSYESTHLLNVPTSTLQPLWNVRDIVPNQTMNIIVTGVWLGATGVDVRTDHPNVAEIIDPFTHSGIVIIGGSPTNTRASQAILFPIQEYMAGRITQTLDQVQTSVDLLSGDNIVYDVSYENVGNTGFFFMLQNTQSQDLRFNLQQGRANVNVPNNTPGWFYADGYDAIRQLSVASLDFRPPADQIATQFNNVLKRYYAPSRFLPVNSSGTITDLTARLTNDQFTSITNGTCMYYADIWYDDALENAFQANVCNNVVVNAVPRLRFAKLFVGENPEDAGDTASFVVRVTNTGYADYVGNFYIRDTFDQAFEVTSAAQPSSPTAIGSNVLTRERTNLLIPARSSVDFPIVGTLTNAGGFWDYGDQFRNVAEIFSGTATNRTLLWTGEATGVIGQPKTNLIKTQTTTNPYIPGDIVVRDIFIGNRGRRSFTGDLVDIRPSDLFLTPQSSLGVPTVVNGNQYVRSGLIIPVGGMHITVTGVVRDGILPSRIGSGYTNDVMMYYGDFNMYNTGDIATGRIEPGLGMSLTKRALQTGAIFGDEVGFRIDFRNTGNVEANFDITDFWPADQLDFVSCEAVVGGQSFACEYNGVNQRAAWFKDQLPNLVPGETGYAIITGRINVPSFDTIQNTVQVKYIDAANTSPLFDQEKTVTAFDAIVSLVALTVQKTQVSLDPQRINDQVGYMISITNIGSRNAENVWILDSFPNAMIADAGVQTLFTGGLGGGQVPLIPIAFNNALLWSGQSMVPTIRPQETIQLYITGTVNDTSSIIGNSFTNTICVRSHPIAVSSQQCATAITTFQDLADIYVQTSLRSVVQAASGYDAIFDITVGNSGARDVNNVTLQNILSSHFTYVSDTLSGSFYQGKVFDTNTRTTTWTGLTLLANDANSTTFTLVARTNNVYAVGTQFMNESLVRMPASEATRETIPFTANPTNNRATAMGQIQVYTDYGITLTPKTQLLASGGIVPLTARISGDTNVGLTVVKIFFPQGMNFVSSTRPNGLVDTDGVYWIVNANEFAGGFIDIDLLASYLPATYAFGQQTFTGSVAFSILPYASPAIQDTAQLIPAPDMQINMYMQSQQPQSTGDAIQYTVRVINNGGATGENVIVYMDDAFVQQNYNLTHISLDGGLTRQVRQRSVVNIQSQNYYQQALRDRLPDTAFPLLSLPRLSPGEVVEIQVYGILTQNTGIGSPLVSTGIVITQTPEFTGGYINGLSADLNLNIATTNNQIEGVPDLSITKLIQNTGDLMIGGDYLAFELRFANIGTWPTVIPTPGVSQTELLRITDQLPAELEVVAIYDGRDGSVGYVGHEASISGNTITYVQNNLELACTQDTLVYIRQTSANRKDLYYDTYQNYLATYDISAVSGDALVNLDYAITHDITMGTNDLRVQAIDLDTRMILAVNQPIFAVPTIVGQLQSIYVPAGSTRRIGIIVSPLTDQTELANRTLSISLQVAGSANCSQRDIVMQNSLTSIGSYTLGSRGQYQMLNPIRFVSSLNNINGTTGTLAILTRLRQDYMANTCFVNTGSIAMPVGRASREVQLYNNTSSVGACVVGSPDLWINKTVIQGQGAFDYDEPIVYRISYGNSGTALADNFTIRDTFDRVLDGLTSSPAWSMVSIDDLIYIWNGGSGQVLPSLAPGASGEIILTGYLPFDYRGGDIFTNTGSITLINGIERYTTGNNQSSDRVVAGGAPDLAITKQHVGALVVTGDSIEYQINITNTGTTFASGPIVIYDELPSNLSYMTGVAQKNTASSQSTLSLGYTGATTVTSGFRLQTFTLNTGLDIGESILLRFTVSLIEQLNPGTIVTNTARTDIRIPEMDTTNNRAVDTIEIGYTPGVAIQASFAQVATGVFGDQMVLRLQFNNNSIAGSGDALGVVITDRLPLSGFTFDGSCTSVSHPSIVCSYNQTTQTITTNAFTLTGGATGELLIPGILNIQPLDTLCVTHTGSISAPGDIYLADNLDVASVCFNPGFDLTLTKTARTQRTSPVDPRFGLDMSGAYIAYDFVVQNSGLLAVTGVALRDIITTNALEFPVNIASTLPILDQNISLPPNSTYRFTLTGTLLQRNFASISNTGELSFTVANSPMQGLRTAFTTVIEPIPVCNNFILERGEACETLIDGRIMTTSGTVLSLDPSQRCRSCQIETSYVVNVAEICTDGICQTGQVRLDIPDVQDQLTIDKVLITSGTIQQGNVARFGITITNVGNRQVNNVMVTDSLPAGLTLTSISATPIGSASFQTGSNQIQVLIPSIGVGTNNAITIYVEARVTTNTVGSLVNQACIVGLAGGNVCDTASVLVGCPSCVRNVNITKTLTTNKAYYASGDQVGFAILVQNNSNLSISGVQISDIRPDTRIRFVSASSTSVGSFVSGWTVGTLAPGQSAIVNLTGLVVTNDLVNVVNTGRVNYTYLSEPFVQEAIATIAIGARGDANVTKVTTTPGMLTSGDIAGFIIEVTNTSPIGVQDLDIIDIRPSTLIRFDSRRLLEGSIEGVTSGTTLPAKRSTPILGSLTGKIRIALTGTVIVDQQIQATNTVRLEYSSVLDPTIVALQNPQNRFMAIFTRPAYHAAAGDQRVVKEDSATVNVIGVLPGTCQSFGPNNVVINIDTLRQQQGAVTMTCTASNTANIATTKIEIDCGNGNIISNVGSNVFSGVCLYTRGGDLQPRCIVNGNQQAGQVCTNTLSVRENESFGVCGNGRLDRGEKCDLGRDSRDAVRIDNSGCLDQECLQRDTRYIGETCQYCDIIDDNRESVIESPLCQFSDVALSVQPGEILPLRWSIGYNDYEMTNDCRDRDTAGKMIRGSMQCRFKIFNRGGEVVDNYGLGIDWIDCDVDSRGQNSPLFDYFRENIYTKETVQYADGKHYIQLPKTLKEFGEYKFSLEEIRYDYCDEREYERRATASTRRVCQSNFVVTKPYLMQRGSTTSVADSDLSDFYDLAGTRILDSIALRNIQSATANTYRPSAALIQKINELVARFDNPKTTTAISIVGQTARKVIGRDIFIVGNGTTYIENVQFGRPITVIAKGDLVIKGDIKSPTMFVVNGNVAFIKEDCTRQVINGIVLTKSSFISGIREQPNTQVDQNRCPDGGLTINGLLIGQNIEDIFTSKRSNLNQRFKILPTSSTSLIEKRRNEIYEGAAVLINHNPQLRSQLPPIANELSTELQFFRK